MAFAGRGWFFRWRVQHHLHGCQECRTRQAAIEAAGHFWTNSFRPVELSPERLESARARFLDRASTQILSERPLPHGLWRAALRAGAASATVACALFAGIHVWKARVLRYVPPARAAALPVISSRPAAPAKAEPARGAVVTSVPPVASVATIPPVTITIDPRETAVDLLWAIHRAGLCRSGSVDVEVDRSGEVILHGVVDTNDQAADLKGMLKDVRGPYSFRVRAADAVAIPVSSGASLAVPSSAPSQPPLGEALIESWLKAQHLDTERANAESLRISNQVVGLASDAWIESWAVRHLLDRFGRVDSRVLSHASRLRLAEMVRVHLDALQHAVARESAVLLPILNDGQEGVPAASPDSAVSFADVTRLSAMIQDTFAGSSATPVPVQERTAQLRTLLAQVSRLALRWSSMPIEDWDQVLATLHG